MHLCAHWHISTFSQRFAIFLRRTSTFFRTAGKVQNFSVKTTFLRSGSIFFRIFFERGQTTGLLLVKSGFGARTIFLRGSGAEVSRRHCSSEVPSRPAGKQPLRNSNFSFSEEPFPERFKNFPKILFPSCRKASKIFRKSSKICLNNDFPYLQITADAVLATPAFCPGTIQGYSQMPQGSPERLNSALWPCAWSALPAKLGVPAVPASRPQHHNPRPGPAKTVHGPIST